MIKAVIFDFGRVISAQKPPSLFLSYEEELGIQPGTINTIMFESTAWTDALLGRMSYDEFWQTIGPDLRMKTPSAIRAFQRRYHEDEAVSGGVLEIILRLYGRYKLAVLSNSPPGLSSWLADWGILNLFDVVFCSGDEGMMKPDGRVYRQVVERLGLEVHEAVFVDDTETHVRAAQMLGLKGIVFTTAEALEEELERLLDQ